MAVIPEIPDSVVNIKVVASSANSVPELRSQVIALADEVKRLQDKIIRLEQRK